MATTAVLASLFALSAEGQSSGLFAPADTRSSEAVAVASATVDDIALRQRVVTIDFDMLARMRATVVQKGAPETLVLNLFDDLVLTGLVEGTAPTFSGGYSVSGGIAGQPLATVTLVVNGSTVAGSVRTLDGTYRIRSAGDGLYSISQIDDSKIPFECEVVEPLAGKLERQ